MHRREFVTAAAGAIAAGTLGCRPRPAQRVPFAAPLDASAFHASRRFASTAFGRIAYVERGAGPAALFIHGLPLNSFQWRGALERLASDRRCIAPDSMGLGYSEIPAGQSLAPEAQADMFAAFLDALGVHDVDVVASDSGGAVAQLFVARFPDRVRTLLLTNCDVHDDSPPPGLAPVIAMARAGTFVDQVLAPQLANVALARGPVGLATCCYTSPLGLTPEALEVYLRPLTSSPLRKAQLHAYCVALARNPLLAIEPALARCQVPLRVVWGMGDRTFDPKGAEWLDRTFPRSRGVRRLDGANLFFPEEFPDVIAEEARRLWRSA